MHAYGKTDSFEIFYRLGNCFLVFLRVSRGFCSSDSINAAEIITSFALSGYKKAYFN